MTFNNFKFKFILYCFILSIGVQGLGNHLFGLELPLDLSTLLILLIFIFQLFTVTLRVPKILLVILGLILIQTFLINFNNLSFLSSLKNFIGLSIYSVSLFSFLTVYKGRLLQIIIAYNKFVLIIAIIAVTQILLFKFFNVSFMPRDIISGDTPGKFRNEIFGLFPRAIGLSTEPAHHAIISLPAVYFSLLFFFKKETGYGISNNVIAGLILLGFFFAFSIVGFLGMLVCVVLIYEHEIFRLSFSRIFLISILILFLIILLRSSIGYKVYSLSRMIRDPKKFEYTTSDATGWALVSNLVITRSALKKSHYLGTGLNTHEFTYDAFIYKEFRHEQVIAELNKVDGGSLFIRMTSEFGIPGILFFLFLLFHLRIKSNSDNPVNKTLNTMSFAIVISYCIRHGAYLDTYFIFFLALLYTTYILELKRKHSVCRLPG